MADGTRRKHRILSILLLDNSFTNFPTSDRNLVRKLETLNKRLIQNNYNILFNETCIKEKLLPKYTTLRVLSCTYFIRKV